MMILCFIIFYFYLIIMSGGVAGTLLMVAAAAAAVATLGPRAGPWAISCRPRRVLRRAQQPALVVAALYSVI